MRIPACVACASVLCGTAVAQNVTVQQPVIGTFGVNTAVTVPDRGEALLGRVGSRFSAHNSFGPFWSGTGTGYGINSGAASARVWIHDPHEMDAAILGSFEKRIEGVSPDQRGALAREILRSRSRHMDPLSSEDRSQRLFRAARFASQP